MDTYIPGTLTTPVSNNSFQPAQPLSFINSNLEEHLLLLTPHKEEELDGDQTSTQVKYSKQQSCSSKIQPGLQGANPPSTSSKRTTW